MLSSCSAMRFWAPVPMATMAITEATPMITHDPEVAQRAQRTLHLRDGRLEGPS